MAGYSGTPLHQKLGIKERMLVKLVQAPQEYLSFFEEMPSVIFLDEDSGEKADLIHFFVNKQREMELGLMEWKDQIKKDGMIWVSWYKKSAKKPTEITEDLIRNEALKIGLVDVKVCAVNDEWSGLKLVWRKELR